MTPAAERERLGARPLLWRILATVAVIGLLVSGQFSHSDDTFPFGALAMFAQRRDPNGIVDSTCLEGSAAGETAMRRIPLAPGTVGIARAELEAHLDRYRRDPARLAGLAGAYAARHPGEEPLVRLAICRDRYRLRDGAPDGPPLHEVLVEWRRP